MCFFLKIMITHSCFFSFCLTRRVVYDEMSSHVTKNSLVMIKMRVEERVEVNKEGENEDVR